MQLSKKFPTKKLFLLLSVFLLLAFLTAPFSNADSTGGIIPGTTTYKSSETSDQDWQKFVENYKCPSGAIAGQGTDLNYTEDDPTDDRAFVTCLEDLNTYLTEEQENILASARNDALVALKSSLNKIVSSGYTICFELKPPSIPLFTSDINSNKEILNKFYLELTSFVNQTVQDLKSKCSTTTPSQNQENSSNCGIELENFNQQVGIAVDNFTNWSKLWKDSNLLKEVLVLKNLTLEGAYNYWLGSLNSEIDRLNALLKKYDYYGNFKIQCQIDKKWEIYRQNWSSALELGENTRKDMVKTYTNLTTNQDTKPLIENTPKPTVVIVDAPKSVRIDKDGYANFEVVAYAIPEDKNKLESGKFSLDATNSRLVYKGGCGFQDGVNIGVSEKLGLEKPGYQFLILNFKLKTIGNCSGQIRYYGDGSQFARSDGYFSVQIEPVLDSSSIQIKDISLSKQIISPGEMLSFFYWIVKPTYLNIMGLGAGIGEFGQASPFGEDNTNIGWSLGFVKGNSLDNGLYQSNIYIPKTAKPGLYKTFVFWKGIAGPVYGPDITISAGTEQQNNVQKCNVVLDSISSNISGVSNSIKYLSSLWQSYETLATFIKAKNLTLQDFYALTVGKDIPMFRAILTENIDLVISAKGTCSVSGDLLYSKWNSTFADANSVNDLINRYELIVTNNFTNFKNSEPKLIPKIGKITQIVGGCQVEILNYDPSFRWYAKGKMVIDVNGVATITEGSIDQYLSTEKSGFQTVNYIDGIFKCPGISKLSENSVDVQAPSINLVSISSSVVYKGQSFTMTFLILDNKEVNNFKVALFDQIGQEFNCYEGVAWKARISGDNATGYYKVECMVRSVSYDGDWTVRGYATDLNFNTSLEKVFTKVRVLYGEPPVAISTDNLQNVVSVANTTQPLPKISNTRTVGTLEAIKEAAINNIVDASEEAKLVAVTQKLATLPTSTKLKTVSTFASVKDQINVIVETPKICNYKNGLIIRLAKGTCIKTVELIDSQNNKYVLTQKILFK